MSGSVLTSATMAGSATLQVAQMRKRTPHLRAAIRRFMPPDADASIVDLGAGVGAFIHTARSMGYRNVEGCDLALDRVNAATGLGLDSVVHEDLFAMLAKQGDGSHDVVVSFDVLEHLTKRQAVDCSGEVYRVLRTGGRWLIHTVNAESPFSAGSDTATLPTNSPSPAVHCLTF